MVFTSEVEPRPYLLINKVQHYAWGARGKEAFIPKLLGLEESGDQPYAELWMGAHPKAPSEVVINGSKLSIRDFIAEHPREILGEKVFEKFSGEFPFLFKVLSAAEPLSIQAHPDREQAVLLHRKDPVNYPDANHKPELAVALGPFTALVGFRPVDELLLLLEKYPEIRAFTGENEVSAVKEMARVGESEIVLRRLFAGLIKRSVSRPDDFVVQVERLKKRLENIKGKASEEEKLFLELSKKYNDVGLFALFFLNIVHLEKGEGIFLEAGVPHAYVRGDIVECMANSDNVVRVGLTPKYKDAETLLEIVKYKPGVGSVLSGKTERGKVVYDVPAEEFRVTRYLLSKGEAEEVNSSISVELWLVMSGRIDFCWKIDQNMKHVTFRKGDSFLVPAILDSYEISALQSSELFKVDVPV